ncbi:uncharacterized protein TNCV_4046151 [Trichonephila clavipes]|nr:uncharacterized protein TNCV_4046151 [Trichonephila clavipes]
MNNSVVLIAVLYDLLWFINVNKQNIKKNGHLRSLLKEVEIDQAIEESAEIMHINQDCVMAAEIYLERYRLEFVSTTSECPSASALRWAMLRLYEKRVAKSRIKFEGPVKIRHNLRNVEACERRNDTLSRTQDFEWHRHFKENRTNCKEYKRFDRSQTFRSAENFEKVSEAVRKNILSTVSEIAELARIFLATNQRILAKDLNMHREETLFFDMDPVIRFRNQKDHYQSLINTIRNRTAQIKNTFRENFVKLAKENSDWTAFAEAIRADIRLKKERIRHLEESLGLKKEEFSRNPTETQRRLLQTYENLRHLEEEEHQQIEQRMSLIEEQQKEIQRLHGLLTVEEKGKIVRKIRLC